MNKEDQEIKNLIDRCNECKFATCENCEINWTQIQAVSKLQKENTILQYNYTNLKEERKDCIHKDKIKDKIKELEKETRETFDKYGDMVENKTISVLKSLLEGE